MEFLNMGRSQKERPFLFKSVRIPPWADTSYSLHSCNFIIICQNRSDWFTIIFIKNGLFPYFFVKFRILSAFSFVYKLTFVVIWCIINA